MQFYEMLELKLIVLCGFFWVPSYGYNYHYMEEVCNSSGYHIDLVHQVHTYGYVKLVRVPGYDPNMNCLITVIAPPDNHLMVRFRRIEIYKPTSSCADSDYLDLFGNTDSHRFCGFGTPQNVYVSVGDRLNLRFISGNHAGIEETNDYIGFDLYYTSFHDGVCDDGPNGLEFKCKRGGHCIPRELTCDSKDNCGDWSDERTKVCGMDPGSIVMVTLITVLLSCTCIAACVYYVVDNKKDRRRRSRNGRSNDVQPAYTIGNTNNNPVITAAQEPPPYSPSPPDYSQYQEKRPLPPAYDNQAYESTTTSSVDDSNTTAAAASEPESSTSQLDSGNADVTTDTSRNTQQNQEDQYEELPLN